MLDPKARTRITYSEQFSDSATETDLQPGFIAFHRRNFCKYFQLAPDEFRDKYVLETGAGPGKHAAVLHSLGTDVTAIDLLDSNIEAINRLKAKNNLSNLAAYQADLMHPLPEDWRRFDLISAHNWLQHTSNPGTVLGVLTEKLKVGGRLYLSVYQSGTFRFFISQIARSVLRWNDREVAKKLMPFLFPMGLLEFENPDDIYFENVFDDFWVPHMWAFRYESLRSFANDLGYEVLTPHTGHRNLCEIDNEPLKVGLIKTSEKTPGTSNGPGSRLEYNIDEFDTSNIKSMAHRKLIEETVELGQRAIYLLQKTDEEDAYIRSAFALGLYRLRGIFSNRIGAEERHMVLQGYLRRFVTGDTASIRAWASSNRYYGRESD